MADATTKKSGVTYLRLIWEAVADTGVAVAGGGVESASLPLIRLAGTRDTAGDGAAIIAAPTAGNEIIIADLHIQLAADATAQQVATLKGGTTDTAGLSVGMAKAVDGVTKTWPQGSELRLGDANAAFLSLTETTLVRYFLQYRIGAIL